MKKQFSLDEWLKDQSMKVVTEHGEPVKIVFTDGMGNWPVLAVIYDGDTTDSAWYTRDGLDTRGDKGLFIITDEPEELTEFEEALDAIYESCGVKELCIKEKAAKLLGIAYYQFEEKMEKDGIVTISNNVLQKMLDDKYKEGYECCQEHDKERISKAHLEGYAKGREDAEKRHKDATSFHFPMYGSFVPPCYLGGPCTNPHHDCIGCPLTGTSGIAKTDTNIK